MYHVASWTVLEYFKVSEDGNGALIFSLVERCVHNGVVGLNNVLNSCRFLPEYQSTCPEKDRTSTNLKNGFVSL